MPLPLHKGRLGRGLASLIGETPNAEPGLPLHGDHRLISHLGLKMARGAPL